MFSINSVLSMYLAIASTYINVCCKRQIIRNRLATAKSAVHDPTCLSTLTVLALLPESPLIREEVFFSQEPKILINDDFFPMGND